MLYDMIQVTTLELRQSLSRVVRILEEAGEPVILARGKRPVAVLISLQDFEERFVEKAAREARDQILDEMDALARPADDPTEAVKVLRQARYG